MMMKAKIIYKNIDKDAAADITIGFNSGLIWSKWIASSDNTCGLSVSGDDIVSSGAVLFVESSGTYTKVTSKAVLVDNGRYYLFTEGKDFTVTSANRNLVGYTDADMLILNIPEYIVDNFIIQKVVKIGNRVFEECLNLISITLPESVTSIERDAFGGCRNLISIIIPNTVTSIGKYAFRGCASLTSINIPDGVTAIEARVFYRCTNLNSITIPDSVTSIGINSFSFCESLPAVTIPNSVTSIGARAFSCCGSLTTITLPNGLATIGDDAFSYCESLPEITIPNSVTAIGKDAFYRALTHIYIDRYESDATLTGRDWGVEADMVHWKDENIFNE